MSTNEPAVSHHAAAPQGDRGVGTAIRTVSAAIAPLVMMLLFYVVFAPVAVLLRLAGRDRLRLTRDRAAATYWVARRPPAPAPGSMTKQYS